MCKTSFNKSKPVFISSKNGYYYVDDDDDDDNYYSNDADDYNDIPHCILRTFTAFLFWFWCTRNT